MFFKGLLRSKASKPEKSLFSDLVFENMVVGGERKPQCRDDLVISSEQFFFKASGNSKQTMPKWKLKNLTNGEFSFQLIFYDLTVVFQRLPQFVSQTSYSSIALESMLADRVFF